MAGAKGFVDVGDIITKRRGIADREAVRRVDCAQEGVRSVARVRGSVDRDTMTVRRDTVNVEASRSSRVATERDTARTIINVRDVSATVLAGMVNVRRKISKRWIPPIRTIVNAQIFLFFSLVSGVFFGHSPAFCFAIRLLSALLLLFLFPQLSVLACSLFL